MDWQTEAWVQLNDTRSPLSMSAKEITARITHNRNPDRSTVQTCYKALLLLVDEGIVQKMRVSGTDNRYQFYSIERIHEDLYNAKSERS